LLVYLNIEWNIWCKYKETTTLETVDIIIHFIGVLHVSSTYKALKVRGF